MENKKLDFIIIPNKVLHCKNLRANAKLLMGVIINLCNSKGHCWASNIYLAEIFQVDRMTISKWVNSLEKSGFIKCKLLGANKRNIYISKSISAYILNYLHISKATAVLDTAVAIDNNINNKTNPQLNEKDDFEMEEESWIDKNGKKHKSVSIDYGEEN